MAANKTEVFTGTHTKRVGSSFKTFHNIIIRANDMLFRSDDMFETEEEADNVCAYVQASIKKPRKKKDKALLLSAPKDKND